MLPFYAIPIRSYQSVWFRVKLIPLVLAGFAGAASLLLWACPIFAGRFAADNWFDCDRQPQPAFANWAAG